VTGRGEAKRARAPKLEGGAVVKKKAECGSRTSFIKSDEVYTLEEFTRRTGLRDWAMRTARRAGLRTVRVGKRTFIHGRDFFTFLESQGSQGHASRGHGLGDGVQRSSDVSAPVD
jgi:hypothetical protein